MKLNLGSGKKYKGGWVNVDLGDKDLYGNKIKVDMVYDLNNFPYPFEENTFDEINASAIIEHLESRTKSWSELKRIAKNGCKIHVRVPHYSGCQAYYDPTHYHKYGYKTAKFISLIWGFKVLENKIQFSANKFLSWMNPIVNIFPIFYERFFCNIIPSQEIFWEFEVVK